MVARPCRAKIVNPGLWSIGMSKPRPFLVGVLAGSMAMSPAAWAFGRAPASDAIVVQSGGIDALLVDKKDAGLKRALMMLDDRLLELPAELDQEDMPAGMIKTVWDQLISPMTLRFAMDDAPAEGAAPFHMQLIVQSMEPGSARSTAGMIASMLEDQGAEWAEGPAGGIRETEAPFGRMMLGAAAVNGKESLVIGMNGLNLDAPALDVTGLLPKGVAPAMAFHADMKQMTPLMQMAMQHPQAAAFADMMESAGMMGEDAIVMDGAFGHGEDRMYGGAIYRGYAKAASNWGMLPGKSLPKSFLQAVPADATYVAAGMFDWSSLPQMLRMFAEQAGEEQDPFEVMAEELGFNPDTDLIAHLGDTYAMYQSDTTGGGGLMSMIGIVTLKDAAAFARTHEQIKTRINQLGAREARGYVKIHSWQEGGMQAFTLMTPGLPVPLELTWTIAGDRLVVGASPGAVISAVNQMKSGKTSILDNKKLAEMAGGPLDNLMAIEFVDTPRFVKQGYGVASVVGSMISNAVRSPSDASRDPGPIMMPYHEFVKGVQPMVVTGRWNGDDLVYSMQGDRSVMVNIAGAGGAMGGMAGIVVMGALAAGVLMPALSGARESALEVQSMAVVRAIGQGAMIYASMNDDVLPASLDVMIERDLLTREMLTSRLGPAWDEQGDYGYRTDLAGTRFAAITNPSQTLLAIDRAMLLNRGTTVAVFCDGHAEALDPDQLTEYLAMEFNQGAIEAFGVPDWMTP